jgi:hypothetical protein
MRVAKEALIIYSMDCRQVTQRTNSLCYLVLSRDYSVARDIACKLSLAGLTPYSYRQTNSDRFLAKFLQLQRSLLSADTPLGFTGCLVLDTLAI